MKRILAITLLLVGFAVTATAQKPDASKPKKTPEERATAYANKMQKDLGLNAEQKTKVHDLALARATKMKELREKYKDQDKKVWKEERKKVRDEFHNGMKSTLSPEQYLKWVEMQKKKAEQMKGKAKGKAKGKVKGATTTTTGTTEGAESDEDPELDGE
jgi:periplasmic protein CpxP/Spy